jgi:hypothetical protein
VQPRLPAAPQSAQQEQIRKTKEKLPNLPNLPKYDNAFSGNVRESGYERRTGGQNTGVSPEKDSGRGDRGAELQVGREIFY